jgi:thymidylate synthase (FAD)
MGNIVVPKVYKIAETKLNDNEVLAWLEDIGGETCLAHVTGEDKERLIELAGRRCYKSYVAGLNPNVTKVRTDSDQYHENVLKSKHGSILEHCSVSFAIENVSRVVTHELVRHRAGAAYSQESLRFVRLTDINMFFPTIFKSFGEDMEKAAMLIVKRAIKDAESVQWDLMQLFEKEMEGNFETKKKLTSAFRRFAPEGLATGIVVTYNFRELRHIITVRTSKHAEEEIRNVCGQMAEILIKDYPKDFGDFKKIDTLDGMYEYVPEYEKV